MTALLDELRDMIAAEGPVSIERYMALCLAHPIHGYYMTRDPFGAEGDFTTSPEISQMFGELIGLWAAEAWRLMDSPPSFRLVELGPGRGTLMADLLRAVRIVPGFLQAAAVHLVETSPVLRARQQDKLSRSPAPVAWHERLSDVPPGPMIVIANELFDALPVRQFVSTERGWCERVVGLGPDRELVFGLASEPEQLGEEKSAPGDVLEWPGAALDLVKEVARRIAAAGGAALVIDYGHAGAAFGDTLQAVKRHTYTDPLAEPGEADLTAHVNFARLGEAARSCGATVHGPVAQRDFLQALGIEARARTLQAHASGAQAADVEAALRRLSGDSAGEMGRLFKVMAVAQPTLLDLPGFPARPTRSPRDNDAD